MRQWRTVSSISGTPAGICSGAVTIFTATGDPTRSRFSLRTAEIAAKSGFDFIGVKGFRAKGKRAAVNVETIAFGEPLEKTEMEIVKEQDEEDTVKPGETVELLADVVTASPETESSGNDEFEELTLF